MKNKKKSTVSSKEDNGDDRKESVENKNTDNSKARFEQSMGSQPNNIIIDDDSESSSYKYTNQNSNTNPFLVGSSNTKKTGLRDRLKGSFLKSQSDVAAES